MISAHDFEIDFDRGCAGPQQQTVAARKGDKSQNKYNVARYGNSQELAPAPELVY